MKYLLSFLVCLIGIELSAQEKIKSPDGKIEISFALDNLGRPNYEVIYNSTVAIKPSLLGIRIVNDSLSLYDNFEIVNTHVGSVNDTWQPVWGENKIIKNHYNELEVVLHHKKRDTQMMVQFRVFNDGVGFRYKFPKQKNLNYFTVEDELTEFNLGGDHKAFWLPGDYNTEEYRTTTSYISEIVPKLETKTLSVGENYPLYDNKGVFSVQSPLMMKSNAGLYINIHEAALVNYPAMSLEIDGFGFRSHLTPDAVGNKAYVQTDFNTPWRTIILSDDAKDILASNIIINLNEPCTYESTDWIKPVKYIGVWWEMFVKGSSWAYTNESNTKLGKTDYAKLPPNATHGATTANVKKYIDFAAKHGFDQVLVEGWNEGWEDWYGMWKEEVFDFVTPYPDFDLNYLRDYAKRKGVKLMMHHETSAAATNYERRFDSAFQFMVDNNYNAVKTGYVGYPIPRGEWRSGQWMTNHYRRVAETAAKYKIMVNSHEAVRSTGLHRTYPNWLAQESARGTEFEALGGNNPDHTTILPFTRLVGGPMDYTPGIFQTTFDHYNPDNKGRVSTTLVKQLALYVTMYSPLQMAADIVDNYERFPDAFQFIKDVAVDWDETHILEAEPGDYITIARKAKGKSEWFIGGITDENSRTATLDFSFLPAGKKFKATIYEDAADAHWEKNPMKYSIRKSVVVTNKTVMKQILAPGGGVAISVK
jgi:hypothetical protein